MTAPEIITRLIAATEDMIERLESCIDDGNGELEDDRPAIADAKDAIAQAKEALFPVAGTPEPEGKAVELRVLFDKIVETDEGNYTDSLAYDNWLAGIEFNPLLVAQLLEVDYLSGRREAEQEHRERQQQRSEDALTDLYRRIWLYAPKADA